MLSTHPWNYNFLLKRGSNVQNHDLRRMLFAAARGELGMNDVGIR
jgi:hypothetical protein